MGAEDAADAGVAAAGVRYYLYGPAICDYMTEPHDPMMSTGGARPDVACPGCAYVPTPHDKWVCAPDGCGHSWDTFATGAKCPECGAQFPWTACPVCGRTYSHRAWYRRSA